jgi:hypothetical protein
MKSQVKPPAKLIFTAWMMGLGLAPHPNVVAARQTGKRNGGAAKNDSMIAASNQKPILRIGAHFEKCAPKKNNISVLYLGLP